MLTIGTESWARVSPCLMLIVAAEPGERERFDYAALQAAAAGLRVEVQHPVKWPWAHQTPVRATISEKVVVRAVS